MTARDVQVRRADARRNIAAILDAATECLIRDPQASTSAIARAAGVGRVTLYGHFPSRAELVDAVFARLIREADVAFDGLDLSGDARTAVARLVASSWRVVAAHRSVLVAAEQELPAERIRSLHDRPMERVQALVERGRDDGVFRRDLPVEWLVAIFYTVLHGAADEIEAGRLAVDEAAGAIIATLLAAYTPPGAVVPAPFDLSDG
jgi:TetR/AcrR family transcriptional regulator, mexCD-oprJ operon repressor